MNKIFKAFISKTRTFINFEKSIWIIEALLFLMVSKIMLVMFPFSWVSKRMGQVMAESASENELLSDQIELISEAIRMASKNLPFETACYVQALAGKMMLNWRNLHSTLYLGVLKNESGTTKGHAWLRHGETIVTGHKGYKKYQIIATYS